MHMNEEHGLGPSIIDLPIDQAGSEHDAYQYVQACLYESGRHSDIQYFLIYLAVILQRFLALK